MEPSPLHGNACLTARLADLTEALDDPEIDLGTALRRLDDDLRIAVGSYLGMSMTVTVGLDTVEVTDTDPTDPAVVHASLRVPESALNRLRSGSRVALTFYAALPGAFVDLAADLAWSTGAALSDFVIDEHLLPLTPGVHAGGLGVLSVIHQAIGTLIARGHTLDQAGRAVAHRRDASRSHVLFRWSS
ncbi:MAG: hypothetical protein ACR2KJ_09825 [Jatrophihabitans sp.]